MTDNDVKTAVRQAMEESKYEGTNVRMAEADSDGRPFMLILEDDDAMVGARVLSVIRGHGCKVIAITRSEVVSGKTFVHIKRESHA